jgi:hypothetical protein
VHTLYATHNTIQKIPLSTHPLPHSQYNIIQPIPVSSHPLLHSQYNTIQPIHLRSHPLPTQNTMQSIHLSSHSLPHSQYNTTYRPQFTPFTPLTILWLATGWTFWGLNCGWGNRWYLANNSSGEEQLPNQLNLLKYGKELSGSIKVWGISWLAAKTGQLLKKDCAVWNK